MWLPKDERRLIEGYYVNIGKVGEQKWFEMKSWTGVLESDCVKQFADQVKEYGDDDSSTENPCSSSAERKRAISSYIDCLKRIDIANAALEKRNLIGVQKHETEPDVAGITLTIDGYDLGRKYANWFTWSGLWFEEYRNHWISLIVGILGGVLDRFLGRPGRSQ